MTEVILDAGPLIHLGELDALDVLSDFEILRVPQAVLDEVRIHQPNAIEQLKPRVQLETARAPSAELQTLASALSLDQGEVESLALMEVYPNAIFLTDDAAARLAAEQRGYRVHGTLGVLIRSVRTGRRKPQEILRLLRELPRRSSLFIRPDFLETIIVRLEKEWQIK